MLPVFGLLIAILSGGESPETVGKQLAPGDFLTGPQFDAEIAKPLSGTWSKVEFRTVLNKIAADRRVAIILDRRVDPNAQLPIDIANRSLRDSLQDIAERINCRTSIPENVVFIGPKPSASRLRTLIELRTNDLKSIAVAIPDRRQKELSRRRHVNWHDLDSPTEILLRIAEHDGLTIRNIELVPHDLWAGNTLPNVTVAEAMSVILIQFDLTFGWLDQGRSVSLIPIPEEVVVERRHRSKGRSATDALNLVREQSPHLDVQLNGSELLVRGTVEDQETVTAILNPAASKKPAEVSRPTPLQKRLFTLTLKRIPVRDVMKKLEESQIVFEYDAAALKSAGIDLDQPIDLELEKATADDFLKALFDPLRLSFMVDNLTVKLSPKR